MHTLVILLMLQQAAKVQVHIPTSQAVDISRKLARDLGFRVEDREYYFDLMGPYGGKLPIAGYVDMGFYGHNNLLQEFAISEATGQVADPRTCQVFEFPDLIPFQRGQTNQSGLKPKSQAQLMSDFGCDHLTVIRSPIIGSVRSGKK